MTDKKLTILHIGSDEKFINGANYLFEKAFPGSNTFLIPLSRFRKNFLHVKKEPNIVALPYDKNIVRRLSKRTEDYDCVILHGITEINSSVFLSSSEKKKFVGNIWGAEIYRDDNYPDKIFLGELTASISLPEPAPSLKEKTVKFLKRLVYCKSVGSENAIKLAASGLSYLCGLNKIYYEDLKKRGLISQDYRLIPFTYYPLEFIMKGSEAIRIEGNDIMVGNSASFTNNHLEAFEILKKLKIEHRHIVVPLSYGNTLYGDHIEAVGKKLFNKQFQPLRRFMPLQEYNRVLKVCGITIMNHYRSQAVGNIIAMLWLGSKVYLSESNVFFHYLKKIGIILYSIEKDLLTGNKLALENLTQQEVEHNRTVLSQQLSENIITERLKNGLLSIFHES